MPETLPASYDLWRTATPPYLEERECCVSCQDDGGGDDGLSVPCDGESCSCHEEPEPCDGCGHMPCTCDREYDRRDE